MGAKLTIVDFNRQVAIRRAVKKMSATSRDQYHCIYFSVHSSHERLNETSQQTITITLPRPHPCH